MDQETNEAANIIIAELKAQVETLQATLRTYEAELQRFKTGLSQEQAKHNYLSGMYDELLDKVLDKIK